MNCVNFSGLDFTYVNELKNAVTVTKNSQVPICYFFNGLATLQGLSQAYSHRFPHAAMLPKETPRFLK